MTTPTSTTGPAKKAAPRTRPTGPAGTSATGGKATGPATPTRKTMEQHLETIAAGEVMTPSELHDFLESLRALSQGLAFFSHAAASQLHAAARQAARETSDGRLTLVQKGKLRTLLVRMGRQLNSGSAEAHLSAATGAVKTWALMEDFLESLESEHTDRPHRRDRGGFNPFGGK